MEIAHLPDEMLSLIMECLIPNIPSESDVPGPPTDLLNARLVSRKWNSFATPYAFRNVLLHYKNCVKDDFAKWKEMIESNMIRSAARRVTISIADEGRTDILSLPWCRMKWPLFINAISLTEHLARLDEVHARFSKIAFRGIIPREQLEAYDQMYGPSYHQGYDQNDDQDDDQDDDLDDDLDENQNENQDSDAEEISSQHEALLTLFQAIQRRAVAGNCSTIRSLSVESLQTVPLPSFTSSNLFKSVTKNITQLHLQMVEGTGYEREEYVSERSEFEPHLCNHWLAPLSSNLTNLTLYFSEPWVFQTVDLQFPKLKTLKLGYYTIAHIDQFDWVLAQTSVRSLYLETCCITSYIGCPAGYFDDQTICMYGLEELQMGSHYGLPESHTLFRYPGTWKSIFDNIRTKLTNLVDFRFYIHDTRVGEFTAYTTFTDSARLLASNPEPLPDELSTLRYNAFQPGLLPSPWIRAMSLGQLNFGDGEIEIVNGRAIFQPQYMRPSLNRGLETEEGDGQAFDALLKATAERRCHQSH